MAALDSGQKAALSSEPKRYNMKTLMQYIVFLLLLSGCAFPLNDPIYMAEQEEIVSAVLDDTMLFSGMDSAFYIENERWPNSSKEIEAFVKSKSKNDSFDQYLVTQCLDFIHGSEHLKIDMISNEKLNAFYRYIDKVDVSISLVMERADLGAEYDYILKVSSETYQVEGSIDEPSMAKYSKSSTNDYGDIIFQLVFAVIQGLIEGNNPSSPYHYHK